MSESAIDQPFALTDLLDLSVFREVCEAFTQAYNLGVRVFPETGPCLIRSQEPLPFCEEIAHLAPSQRQCQDALDRLSAQAVSGSTAIQVSLFCGCRYSAFPLTYQFDTIGRVVLGPYRDGPWSLQRLLEAFPQKKSQLRGLEGFAAQVPQLEPENFKKLVRFLAKVMDAFIFVNAKRLITTRLHLENILESRQSIFQKWEEELQAAKDDPDSPEKLKGLF
jgi:hypothetical protein